MKTIIPLIAIVLCSHFGNVLGQVSSLTNKRYNHAICFEFWGTSNAYNLQYLFLKNISKSKMFVQMDAIAGYRRKFQGNHALVNSFNFSIALNGGYLDKSGRSILLGCGLGYDQGRISDARHFGVDPTNKSIVIYLRLNYSRRLIRERLILGFSLVYGIKIKEYYEGNDPDFNERINEFQNWFAPAVSIGYCFGKKYFQKEKIGTE